VVSTQWSSTQCFDVDVDDNDERIPFIMVWIPKIARTHKFHLRLNEPHEKHPACKTSALKLLLITVNLTGQDTAWNILRIQRVLVYPVRTIRIRMTGDQGCSWLTQVYLENGCSVYLSMATVFIVTGLTRHIPSHSFFTNRVKKLHIFTRLVKRMARYMPGLNWLQ